MPEFISAPLTLRQLYGSGLAPFEAILDAAIARNQHRCAACHAVLSPDDRIRVLFRVSDQPADPGEALYHVACRS